MTSLDWLLSTSLMPVSMVAVGFLGDAIGAAHDARPRRARSAASLTLLCVLLIPGVRDPEREASGALGEPLGEGVQP